MQNIATRYNIVTRFAPVEEDGKVDHDQFANFENWMDEKTQTLALPAGLFLISLWRFL